MATRHFSVRIELMRNKTTQDQFKVCDRNGQLVLAINNEILLPENARVRLTSAQLEDLDYTKLYRAYSARGRKSKVDPRVLFKVMVYGYQCGIYSSRKLEEACRYRVDFMWLLEEYPAPDHATLARFRTGRCAEAVEDLFYQYVSLLEHQDETDYETVFVDGTKLESCAGRYTFCWRGSVEKHLTKVQERVQEAAGLKSLKALQEYLEQSREGITFAYGKGIRKSDEQRQWEALDELRQRWERYEKNLKIMGDTRNSYSKTDPDATFMRMKDDHMRNGQLKPAYNVQIAVNSEYITGVDVFSNRTDFGTLVPFLKRLQRQHNRKYAEVTADAGYESLENYLYLEANGQLSFIKPSNYEAKKTRHFKEKIGRIENMTYDAEEDCFTCAQGRKLSLRRECTKLEHGQFVTTAWGERTTLFHSIDKLVATLKALGVLECDKPGKYRVKTRRVSNPKVVAFMVFTMMIVGDSGYYSFADINSSIYLFPFEYRMEKEALFEDGRFAMNNFGGELSISLNN